MNKNALLRYRTIDKCLQNRQRRWTLGDLIDACSEALYEYEGKESPVSKRTVQLDIQLMRSDKLGYTAPIVVYEKKYYTYDDPDYSITDIPLTSIDMEILTESVTMLRQFKDFSLFTELNGVIQKLEDKIYRERDHQAPIIHIDKNEQLKGLEHLDTLYQAILKKIVLTITYQSFKAKRSDTFAFHAYILKEYNNRWFVVGKRSDRDAIFTLALDRMIAIELDLKTDYLTEPFDADQYYANTYGVTVLNDAHIIQIELKIAASNAPYVLTKPFHHSQKLLEQYPDGSVKISLSVHHNFEIERLILGFGETIEVLQPKLLRKRIRRKLYLALAQYNSPVEEDEGSSPV
ncbi:MAG: WYL domain-containing protein [Bacteroidota bacterium]